MNTCPNCGAEQSSTEYANAFACGSLVDRRGWYHVTYICKARNGIFLQLQSAKARIESLVKVGDQIIENGSVSERLFNEWTKAKGGA